MVLVRFHVPWSGVLQLIVFPQDFRLLVLRSQIVFHFSLALGALSSRHVQIGHRWNERIFQLEERGLLARLAVFEIVGCKLIILLGDIGRRDSVVINVGIAISLQRLAVPILLELTGVRHFASIGLIWLSNLGAICINLCE